MDVTQSVPESNEILLDYNITTKSIEESLDGNKTTKSSEVSLENSKGATSTEVSLNNNKSTKSASKVKDRSSSSSEISTGNGSNVGHVSRSGRKIKPKKYSDYENDTEPKRSRLSKDNFKTSDKLNTSSIDTDSSSEQNCKTKGKLSIIYF